MKYADLRIKILQETHSMTLLYVLLKEGPTPRTALYNMIGTGTRTMMDRMEDLLSKGLVEDVPTPKSPFRVLQLTEKGREIAELAAQMEETLQKN